MPAGCPELSSPGAPWQGVMAGPVGRPGPIANRYATGGTVYSHGGSALV